MVTAPICQWLSYDMINEILQKIYAAVNPSNVIEAAVSSYKAINRRWVYSNWLLSLFKHFLINTRLNEAKIRGFDFSEIVTRHRINEQFTPVC